MLPDKEIKQQYKPIFWEEPEKYYATTVLKEEGFSRFICTQCRKPFWSVEERSACGDPACSHEGFAFLDKTPAQKKLSYVNVWKTFSKLFTKLGYTPVNRYPTVARWNPTMEYTNASIAAFQPYVITGEIEPPANPLVIPQFCLRFGDTDNVGITMAHNTGFVMIGQHTFVPQKQWKQNDLFTHMLTWNTKGLGLKTKDMIFHEDAWAGGGNLGPCMEMFSRGCELWNQVYMLYEQTHAGVQELKIKVLDMGLGMERNAWFSQAVPSVYDASFPKVLRRLRAKTGVKTSLEFIKKYTPHASLLNIDEADDIEQAWKTVARRVGVNVQELREEILPSAALYSAAEHMRSVLVALHDGALPSNVGGGYNLRMLIRRSLGFITRYQWQISLSDVCSWHAQELKQLYPELSERMDEISAILNVEKQKYEATKLKAAQTVARLKSVNEEDLITLYDSHGISPDMVPGVKVPDDFYARVAARHEQKEQKGATIKSEDVPLTDVPDTKALYYQDYKLSEFSAKVLRIVGDVVVLDQTVFYPTSGGQVHDIGAINNCLVEEVWKQGPLILHRVKCITFNEGDMVKGKIDLARRIQLAQHHTGAHILNAAARRVLGQHINQSGAFKDLDKARLDITHYQSLTQEEIDAIEKEANKIISEAIQIEKKFYPRNEAEKLFGMGIYQGGVAPGKMLRIVNIVGVDVEACGGTHLNNTKEAEQIRILSATKIQDGIVRLTFAAGCAARAETQQKDMILMELSKLLHCPPDEIPGRAEELFDLWKDVVKKKKDAERKLVSTKKYSGDVITETARILKTQPPHVVQTIQRFLKELGM